MIYLPQDLSSGYAISNTPVHVTHDLVNRDTLRERLYTKIEEYMETLYSIDPENDPEQEQQVQALISGLELAVDLLEEM